MRGRLFSGADYLAHVGVEDPCVLRHWKQHLCVVNQQAEGAGGGGGRGRDHHLCCLHPGSQIGTLTLTWCALSRHGWVHEAVVQAKGHVCAPE